MHKLSKFKLEYIEQARKLCEKGFTDYELSQFFDIHRSTLYVWQAEYPDFSAAMIAGKSFADERVERSLYERAVGYSYNGEKVFNDKGEILRADTTEHVPPDTTAAIFWLKNRRKDRWRDKQDVELTGDLNITKIERVIVNSTDKDS